MPHDYVELEKPVQAKLYQPGKYSHAYRQICHQRAYGYLEMAMEQNLSTVEDFIVLRTEKDKRSAYIKWKPVDNAFAYQYLLWN